MYWKIPSKTKIYEALGAVADNRVDLVDENVAKVYSSSRNKFYDVTYNKKENSIMSNDNSAYWQGYLGYPAVALLFRIGELEYKPELAILLKNVAFKDINQKHNNDFEKALVEILSPLSWQQRNELDEYMSKILEDIKKLQLKKLGKSTAPPKGY